MAFVTSEDLKIAFNFFCTVYGIGTLGLPSNFARSGAPLATVALVFMAFANMCSSIAISRVMLAAPKHVKTYGDVGAWCGGYLGRSVVLFAQFGVCCLVPCAFLVLGGILLDGISPGAFEPQYWSIIMAVMLLPVILTPTLKEGAATALVGCLGTLLADVMALGLLMKGIGSDHPAVIKPEFDVGQVASSFGNLAMAFSATVLVPALQREHSQPERMPRVIATTMAFTAGLFLIIGTTAYSFVGCQMPGNLLFAIGGTALNLNANRGAVVLAYMFMQLHITIAMSVILNPVLYIAERGILGMHKYPQVSTVADDESLVDEGIDTPQKDHSFAIVNYSGPSIMSLADTEDKTSRTLRDDYHTGDNVVIAKYVTLRIIVVVLLLIIAIVFKDHFVDFTDFVGAWAVSLACILLPIFFYLKVFWNHIPTYEKAIGTFIILICAGLGGYVTYKTGKNLFLNIGTDKTFQYCPSGYDMVVYTNETFYHRNNEH